MATTPENIRWSEPRFSISQISTLPASFADDLAAYTTAGLDGMGIWELKLPEDGDDTAALEAFAASGLEPASAVPAIPSPLPLPLLGGPTDPQQRIDALCASIHRLAAFGAPAIVCLTGCGRGLDSDRAYAIVVDALRTLAGEAELAGTLIALEPYQAEGGGEWTIVSTIPEALELIAEAGGHSSLGLQFDAWHLWNTDPVLDAVAEHIDRIVGVHVNDYRSPTRGGCDRVLPGDGIAELPVLLGALDAAGWDGLYDLEIFSDDGTFGSPYPDSLWDLPTAELARRGRAAMAAAWDTMRRLAPVGQPQQHKEGE